MEAQNNSAYERVLAAAAKLFATKGYDGTTTREIVKEAGSSLSAIQIYFKSKDCLYQAALERTLQLFYKLNAPVLNEIDEVERQGMLNEDSAWDLIVQLTGQVAEWVFCEDYSYEILLINRELLQPSPMFEELPQSLLGLYLYYEKLFIAYAGVGDAMWAKALSFSIVTSLFDYGNYPHILGQILGCDVKSPEITPRIKTNMKQYLLLSIRTYLNLRKQDAMAEENE